MLVDRNLMPAFALVGSALLLVAASKPRHEGKTWTWNFEADSLGGLPKHAVAVGGAWSVVSDSAGQVIRQTDADAGLTHQYLWFARPIVEDLKASVRFRILSGEIDPTAGLLIQLDRSGRSGYLIRVSGETQQLIAHYLLYRKRHDLKSVAIDPPEPGTWHTLGVERRGHQLIVFYDGEERFRLRDERFHRGSIGIWTEGDTVLDFDDLQLVAERERR